MHSFSQRLPVDWLREHLAAKATHCTTPYAVGPVLARRRGRARRRLQKPAHLLASPGTVSLMFPLWGTQESAAPAVPTWRVGFVNGMSYQ